MPVERRSLGQQKGKEGKEERIGLRASGGRPRLQGETNRWEKCLMAKKKRGGRL